MSGSMTEILLAVYCLGALVIGALRSEALVARKMMSATTLFFVVLIVIQLAREGAADKGWAFGLLEDAFARFAKIAILASGAIVMAVSIDWLQRVKILTFELPILVAFATLGMMISVSATDFIVLYLGLELLALPSYVLAAYRRDSVRSTEAGLKYFVLGALASGLLLYGISLVYGFSGTVKFSGIASVLDEEGGSIGVLLGLVLILSGLAFKVSAVPFHMWTPDVYEGAPTPITAFFATAPKLAAVMVLARVVYECFPIEVADWSQVLVLLALASMFVGAIAAIAQRDLKRLMAYSSITHMGFALLGLAAGSRAGVQATLIYMVLYVIMSIGVFSFILAMRRDGRFVSAIDDLSMLSKSHPATALALLSLMFSLAGVPPFAGFWAKVGVLLAAVDAGLVWLAIAAVIASVIGAFYYLRIVYYMYFGVERDPLEPEMSVVSRAVLAGSAVLTVLAVVNLLGLEGPALAAAEALVP